MKFIAHLFFVTTLVSILPLTTAAATQPPVPPNWNSTQPTVTSETRTTLDLEGVWKFAPAAGTAGQAPTGDDWGWIPVPSSWSSRDIILARGTTAVWEKFDPRTAPAAWYEREFTVPNASQGSEYVLDFSRVSTNAVVFVNEKRAGEINWPEGEVNITSLVSPGKKAILRIYVAAVNDKEFVDVLMGDLPGQNSTAKATLSTQGITGPVTLITRPAGPRLDGVFIQPSVRKKELVLDVETANLKSKKEPVKFTVAIIEAKGGAVEKSAEFTVTPDAVSGVARLVIPWDNPKLWGLGQPNLYRLTLSASTAGWRDQLTERFGFRETWTEGKHIMLNGKRFRNSPILVGSPQQGTADVVAAGLAKEIKTLMEQGFTLAEIWPEDIESRGAYGKYVMWHPAADEAGFPVSGILPHMGWAGNNINSPTKLEAYRKATERILKRLRNHPSIIIWGTSGNAIGGNLDPRFFGQREAAEADKHARNPNAVATDARIHAGVAILKQADPTRPILVHNGGGIGDIFNNNYYLNIIPLQEREEYLKYFQAKGDMPLMFVEFGTPLYSSFMRGRHGYGNTTSTEPLVTEYAAIYFGNEAYKMEASEYLAEMRAQYVKDQTYKGWHGNRVLGFTPPFQAFQKLFISNTWRTWRTAYNTGMIPWDNGYKSDPAGNITEAGRALIENNQPTLAWICGPADAITDKAQQFAVGETVMKSAALINDGVEPLPYKLEWSATFGTQKKNGSDSGTLAGGERKFVPIKFQIDGKAPTEVVASTIQLNATVGTKTHADTFAFSVVPTTTPQLGTAALYDPKGLTGKLLTTSGLKVPAWDGQKPLDPKTTPLVIIGREALSHEIPAPAALEGYVKAGGRVLLMQQQPDYLRTAFDFRVSPHVSRQFFPLNASAQILGPLQTANLRYWRGASSLLPEFLDQPFSQNKIPRWGWHVSNHHGVSSGAIEKPHRSGWRPLLEGEFDLAYSPLLELDYGLGRIVFTQLDFEDHVASDPAAALLFSNLLKYAATSPTQPRVPALFLTGSEPAPAAFTALGAEFTASENLPADARLVVIAPGAKIPANFEKWVEAGGKALVLSQKQSEGILGCKLTLDKTFMGTRNVPDWIEVRGISQSDLRFRNQASVWKLSSGTGLEIASDGLLARRKIGKGVIIFSQLDPSLPEADQRTYLRATRWRQMRAQSQLLANLGAAFSMDAGIFHPKKIVEVIQPPTVSLAVPWKIEVVEKRPGAPSPDKGYVDPGMSSAAKALLAPNVDDSKWATLKMPHSFQAARPEWSGINGEVVLRVTFDVPETLQGKDLEVSLGPVDDGDVTYLNGEQIGALIEDPKGYSIPRVYPIPAKLVKPRGNVLAVRVWDRYGDGGFTSDKPELLVVRAPVKPANVVVEPETTLGFYHPDYRADFELGDDPYRYYNW